MKSKAHLLVNYTLIKGYGNKAEGSSDILTNHGGPVMKKPGIAFCGVSKFDRKKCLGKNNFYNLFTEST